MAWDRIIGQQRIKQLLQRMYSNNRIPHALLFHGPDGVGKEAVALEFARVLNCAAGEWDACGTCPSCRAMAKLQHPHLKLVFALPARGEDQDDSAVDKLSSDEVEEINAQIAEKAANPYHRIVIPKASIIKISSIRDIRREASFRAGSGRTVVVICEADRMNPQAANALLKTLEEPSGDLLLILTTSRRDALLPTILSRCQLLRFDMLSEDDILAGLQRLPDIDRDSIVAAAHLAAGNYRIAMEMVHEGGLLGREEVLEYVRAVVLNNPVRLMQRIQQILDQEDRQTLARFLVSVASWFRDVLALQEGADRLINSDFRDSIEKFAVHYPDARCSEAVSEIENSIALIPKNVHLVTMMIVLSQRLRRCIIEPGA
ncbi:MAG: DNA polymerase III subunit delta' [Bacteroidetes bacterium]|nr:DNA polymerase III subunit delta' [Bacteroidota bacterium]